MNFEVVENIDRFANELYQISLTRVRYWDAVEDDLIKGGCECNHETQDLALNRVCWRRNVVRGLPLPNRPDAERH